MCQQITMAAVKQETSASDEADKGLWLASLEGRLKAFYSIHAPDRVDNAAEHGIINIVCVCLGGGRQEQFMRCSRAISGTLTHSLTHSLSLGKSRL
jgi:hypothetical protein